MTHGSYIPEMYQREPPPERLKNPYEFEKGDIIESWYTRQYYIVVEPCKKGMAKLKDVDSGYISDFNAGANPHFINAKGKQRELF